jgi:DNA-binding transcriptional LysR family regulator
MDLRLRHLRTFVAVAEQLHFGRAGEALGLPQPTVSRHVRELEEQLEVPLLVRTSRATSLTPAGEAVLDHARTLLERAERLRAAALVEARRARGEVTIAFIPSTVTRFLAPLVEALAREAPEVSLRIARSRAASILDDLRSGTIDLAIGREPGSRAGVVVEPLVDERVYAVLPAGHPLAGRDRLAPGELGGEPLIALDPAVWPSAEATLRARLGADGAEANIAERAGSHHEAIALVAAGRGLYQLPESAAVAHPAVSYVELDGLRSRVVLIRGAAPPTPAQQAVVDAARSLAAAGARSAS